ncbi:hypothetical protein FGADI_12122 [Fusarium gaditjirri]|uniref:Uncharacterized protein n=1 Tax=Fusarium gaditjirri TaxID=282569 RepID=A0A8H4ST06_9HYPO|nr:hypothetical protein FGADI_12122 [Fusarium gaditjirri]
MVYGASELQGYRDTLYQFGYGIQLHKCAYYDFPWGVEDESHEVKEVWKDESKCEDCAEFIATLFPTSLEVLLLEISIEITSIGMEEDILIRMILLTKLPSLKAIFIEIPDDDDNIYPFTRLHEVGCGNDIDIWVKTKPEVLRYQIQLPMAP